MYVIEAALHGHEGWSLTEEAISRLRSFNLSCISIITRQPHAELAHDCPFDIIPIVLSRRAKWLGHVLRMNEREPPRRLMREIIKFNNDADSGAKITGTVLDQAPPQKNAKGRTVHTGTFESLVIAAQDRKGWRKYVVKLMSGARHVSVLAEASGQFRAARQARATGP